MDTSVKSSKTLSSSSSSPVVGAAAAAATDNTTTTRNLTSKMIVFKADEKTFCYETNQRANVTVVGSTGGHDHGSSKVKLKSIVDYKWDLRHYPGRLITVHIDGKHIAYAIVVRSNEGMVRVVNPSNGHRALIKGMTTEVLDLQFAHIKNLMVLATIEETALHLHKIDSCADKVTCTVLLRIEDMSPAGGLGATTPALHRLSWCPYVPEKESEIDEYVSQQLVWVRGAQFRCYSVRAVVNMYGIGGRLSADGVEGTLSNRESTHITGASFSPDGTTLCVSGADGVIRFYQVYFHTNEPIPRCLHQWTPHDGKAISSFFFLDNLTQYSKDKSLWRHAITASDDNTEIKVWCCSTWECLQTVHFTSPLPGVRLHLSAQIDRTSSYLVLSDSKQRGLYVLQVQIDAGGTPPRNHAEALLSKRLCTSRSDVSSKGKNTTTTPAEAGGGDSSASANTSIAEPMRSVAYIKSIAEFPLSSPILSYHIVDAAVRRYKCAYNDSYLVEELDDYDEDTQSLFCVVVNMYLVQPKSVQECHVLYQPTVTADADLLSSMESVQEPTVTLALGSSGVSLNGSSVEPTEAKTKADLNAAPLVSSEVGLLPAVTATAAAAAAAKTPSVVSAAAEPTTSITLESLMAAVPLSLEAAKSSMANSLAAASKAAAASLANRSPGTINLMTPDSFNSPRGRETPEGVSSDVRSALQMLAQSQQQQQQQHTVPLTPSSPCETGARKVRRLTSGSSETANVAPGSGDDDGDGVVGGAAVAGGAVTAASVGEAAETASGRQSVEINSQILAPECGASLLAAAAAVASGGSSPSREVQEILINDVINDFFDDSTDQSDDNDDDVDGDDDNSVTGKKNLGEQYNFNEPNTKEPHDTKASLQGHDKGGAWPKVPDLPTGLSNMHCANFNNINAAGGSAAAAAAADAASIVQLGNKMDQMLELIQAQTCQIAELRSGAAVERQRVSEAHALHLQIVEKKLGKVYEEHLQRSKREHAQRLDEYKKTHIGQNTEMRNHIVQAVTQVVSVQVSERITGVLMNELQQRIVPVIVSRLDQIKNQVQSDVAHKLSVCDQLLRDNIAKACSNKSTLEVFGNAVMLGVQSSLQKTYGDSMKGILIPAYERASGEMFRQVQDVFTNGTKAYTKLFENYFAQYEPVQENLNALVVALPDQLKAASDAALAAYTAKVAADLQRDLKAMQTQLMQTVRDNVKNEIKKGFEAQTATIEDSVRSVVRSQSQTPAPCIYDMQEQIKGLLAQGQVNTAFHQALVANDLALVEFTIEKADHATVFNPCPLQPTVLLSLIQQISADMSNHNELKQRYLSEAILSLNMRDPITKEHAPEVLRELFRHCQAYTTANPTSAQNSGIRMLMMAVQGLGIKLF